MIYTLWTHIKKNTYTHWYNTYVCLLSCYYYTHTHKNCAKYSPTYRLDQLCIRRLFDKKEYYYDYCYILLSTTPFPTKIHKKTAQLSKFYPISKKKSKCVLPPDKNNPKRREKLERKTNLIQTIENEVKTPKTTKKINETLRRQSFLIEKMK